MTLEDEAKRVQERQQRAFAAFFSTPEGAWILEWLVVANFILDPVPTRKTAIHHSSDGASGTTEVALTEFERGICEGRRALALEMLDMWQVGIQGAYDAINRVDAMRRDQSEAESYAKQ